MKKIIKIIKFIVSIPFIVIGILVFRIYEIINSEKITYRGDEVVEKTIINLKKIAKCSNCGHKGLITYEK